MKTRRDVLKTAASVLAFAATPAFAQGNVWPNRMIKVIVPLPPGGVMDFSPGLWSIISPDVSGKRSSLRTSRAPTG